jgi:ATP-dependent Lon protease
MAAPDPVVVLPGEGEPLVLPLLPIDGTVLFPGTMLPLLVSDDAARELIHAAAGADRRLAVVARRDPPAHARDVYGVGTAASIFRLLRQPDGRVQVLLHGAGRVRILTVVQDEPYMRARLEAVPEQAPPPGRETDAAVLHLQRLFQEAAPLAPYLGPDAVVAALNAESPGQLADFIASGLRLTVAEKQEVLELADVRLRIERVAGFLARELEMLRLSEKIQTDVQERLGRGQREHLLREQMRSIQRELGEAEDPEIAMLRKRLAEADLPDEVRAAAERELGRLGSGAAPTLEGSMARAYLEWLLDLPWRRSAPERLDLPSVRATLDADHYGLTKVKRRILEHLAVRALKPDARGAILCFVGPPGVGKTSLGQSIARATGRPFARVALGGVRDEAEIRGHRRTYVGALPGRIIQAIRRAGVNNPVLMLDEIDKLGLDFRGDPAAALLEVLDPEQNTSFTDHYIDLPFDLSKVLFICTANLLDPVPGPLRDRMETLALPGYSAEEKLTIAREHLLATELERHGVGPDRLEITDDALRTIIARYTAEAGVRELRRQIAAVARAVALEVAEGRTERVVAGADDLERYLGPPRYFPEVRERTARAGVATGLAWTAAGGDVLFIEATRMPGRGNLILTGQLGDVMKESAQAALSLVRANAARLGVPVNFYETTDLHVHVPAGAVPKDGPSAGVTLYVALVSLLTDRPVAPNVGMTGEITLRGAIMPVGGIREKVLAARRAGLDTVILPRRNEVDVHELPETARREITFHYVSSVDELPPLALVSEAHLQQAAS